MEYFTLTQKLAIRAYIVVLLLLFFTSCEVEEEADYQDWALPIMILALCLYAVFKLGKYVQRNVGDTQPDYPIEKL